MSTRAIIGIKNENGTIIGGWQWNDGKGLLSLLRKEFDTVEKIRELIRQGVWNNIVAPGETEVLERFTKWTMLPNSDYYLVPVGKCHLLKERPCDNSVYCFGGDEGIIVNEDGSMTFADFETAQRQDINYLYLFDPVLNYWRVFR